MNYELMKLMLFRLNPTLGFLRVFLAFLVLDWHFGYYQKFIKPHIQSMVSSGQVYFIGDGRFAVFGFFVASGFLIASILDSKYHASDGNDFPAFFASRFLRILPLYWFVLTLYLIFGPDKIRNLKGVLGNYALIPVGFWAFFLDTKNSMSLYNHLFIGASWTLSLDLVFYILSPFIVWMWYKNRLQIWALFSFMGFYCLIFLFPFYINGSSRNTLGRFDTIYTTGELALFTFLLGMLIFWHRERVISSGWTAALAFSILVYVLYFPVFIGDSFIAFSLGLVSISILINYLYKKGNSFIEQFLSNFTFAVYLIHRPIIRTVKSHTGLKSLLQEPKIALFFFLISILVGVLLAIFFEGPMEKIRSRFVKIIPKYQIPQKYLYFSSYVILFSLIGLGVFSAIRNFH